jgi:hypothetical protein
MRWNFLRRPRPNLAKPGSIGSAGERSRAEGTLRGNTGVGHIFEFAAGTRQGGALLFETRVLHATIL